MHNFRTSGGLNEFINSINFVQAAFIFIQWFNASAAITSSRKKFSIVFKLLKHKNRPQKFSLSEFFDSFNWNKNFKISKKRFKISVKSGMALQPVAVWCMAWMVKKFCEKFLITLLKLCHKKIYSLRLKFVKYYVPINIIYRHRTRPIWKIFNKKTRRLKALKTFKNFFQTSITTKNSFSSPMLNLNTYKKLFPDKFSIFLFDSPLFENKRRSN